MALETPSRPHPPFMANAILNFHFDFLKPSLTDCPADLHSYKRVSEILFSGKNFGKQSNFGLSS